MDPGGTEPTTLQEALQRIENLQRALDTRGVIGQAHGIVMERYGLDEESAFALLTRLSSSLEVKVRDLSEQIVAGVPIDGLEPPPPRARPDVED